MSWCAINRIIFRMIHGGTILSLMPLSLSDQLRGDLASWLPMECRNANGVCGKHSRLQRTVLALILPILRKSWLGGSVVDKLQFNVPYHNSIYLISISVGGRVVVPWLFGAGILVLCLGGTTLALSLSRGGFIRPSLPSFASRCRHSSRTRGCFGDRRRDIGFRFLKTFTENYYRNYHVQMFEKNKNWHQFSAITLQSWRFTYWYFVTPWPLCLKMLQLVKAAIYCFHKRLWVYDWVACQRYNSKVMNFFDNYSM